MDIESLVEMCTNIYNCKDVFEQLVIEEALEIPCQIISEQLEHLINENPNCLKNVAEKQAVHTLLDTAYTQHTVTTKGKDYQILN